MNQLKNHGTFWTQLTLNMAARLGVKG